MDVGRPWPGPLSATRALGGERPLTYREWDARTKRIARALASLGFEHSSRVAMVLPNTETLASTHLACQKLGAVSTPLNIATRPTSSPTA
ncbi:MAG: AMP-binding protein [Streptosporangiaceae bacterium]